MPEYLRPGVDIEEARSGPEPIEGVNTHTAGFAGRTERGPAVPVKVASWAEYVEAFGDVLDPDTSYLPFAVRGFFENGGHHAWIARVIAQDADAVTAADYIGDPGAPAGEATGLAGLARVDDVRVLVVPDEVHAHVPDGGRITEAVVEQCETRRDRFAVLSIAQGQADIATVRPPRESSYAAVYYPWVRVADPRSGKSVLVPPAGHVAGIYARTDIERGVHKAPANAQVKGLVSSDPNSAAGPLEYQITNDQQDVLNPLGVNVIRDFRSAGRGILLWGARTCSPRDPEWKYVNVRRLLIYLERSIDRGMQWVVFEPNDQPLWTAVRRLVENFLVAAWRDGALLGTKPEHAFYVRCGRDTMTQADIDNGRLICEIGVAPVRPAEFIVLRFGWRTRESAE
jgi:phage tail sheath protein FI